MERAVKLVTQARDNAERLKETSRIAKYRESKKESDKSKEKKSTKEKTK